METQNCEKLVSVTKRRSDDQILSSFATKCTEFERWIKAFSTPSAKPLAFLPLRNVKHGFTLVPLGSEWSPPGTIRWRWLDDNWPWIRYWDESRHCLHRHKICGRIMGHPSRRAWLRLGYCTRTRREKCSWGSTIDWWIPSRPILLGFLPLNA